MNDISNLNQLYGMNDIHSIYDINHIDKTNKLNVTRYGLTAPLDTIAPLDTTARQKLITDLERTKPSKFDQMIIDSLKSVDRVMEPQSINKIRADNKVEKLDKIIEAERVKIGWIISRVFSNAE
ncbi:hypothetical protein AGMMS50268_39950 [Spirochaetia bacterium]|nr:hypothetical protein AGMMS50268_39950 [Spirochaetia bacterium]